MHDWYREVSFPDVKNNLQGVHKVPKFAGLSCRVAAKMGCNYFWRSVFIPIMFSWYLFSYGQDICFCLKHSVVACRLHQLAQQSHWPRNSARLLETQPHALDFSNAPSKIISTRFWLLGFVRAIYTRRVKIYYGIWWLKKELSMVHGTLQFFLGIKLFCLSR